MKRISAALLIVLALSGCAVTGQPARPGTAAIFEGRTVTNDDVAAWSTALNELGFATYPGDALTLLLLEPAAAQAATNDDKVDTDDEVKRDAVLWALAQGRIISVDDVTDDQVAVVRTVRQLATQVVPGDNNSITFTQPVLDTVAAIEDHAQVSPEYGDFSQEVFTSSVAAALDEVTNYANAQGQVSYLVLKGLNGFNPYAQREWMGDVAPVEGAAA
jgi:hypothetical protein